MTAFYNEIDPYAAQWLRNLIAAGHIAPGVVDERDIRDILPSELAGYTQCHFFAGIGVWSYALRLAGWPDDRPVWTGSCPCQPFSDAGAGAAFDDERHLWPHWFHLIERAKPRAVPVFGEQVASKDGLAWLDLVHADMERAKHAVGAVDLCAAGVGAPHIRQRLFFVADANAPRLGKQRSIRVRRQHLHDADGRSAASILADTTGERSPRRDGQPSGRHGADEPERLGATGLLGNAGNARLAQCVGLGKVPCGASGDDARQAVERAGAHAGFWSAADWIACRDGKARPVEPGTFPLAHGATSRVGRLRAYGNAINAEAAAAFIGSYLDVTSKPAPGGASS